MTMHPGDFVHLNLPMRPSPECLITIERPLEVLALNPEGKLFLRYLPRPVPGKLTADDVKLDFWVGPEDVSLIKCIHPSR